MAIIRLIIRFDSIEINYDTALCSLPLTHACFLLFFIAFYLGIFRLFFLVLHVYRTSIFNMGGQHLMSYCLHWQPAMYIFYSLFSVVILWQTTVSETIRNPPLVEAQNAVGKNAAENDFQYGGHLPF